MVQIDGISTFTKRESSSRTWGKASVISSSRCERRGPSIAWVGWSPDCSRTTMLGDEKLLFNSTESWKLTWHSKLQNSFIKCKNSSVLSGHRHGLEYTVFVNCGRLWCWRKCHFVRQWLLLLLKMATARKISVFSFVLFATAGVCVEFSKRSWYSASIF